MALADCCEIVSGATPSTSVDDYWDGDICWATPKDLSDLDGHYISDTPRKITRKGLSSCAAAILPANSVLFSSRAPIGHVAVNTVPMATNQGFKSFVPKPNVLDAKFLFHWLRANRAYLESLGNGATFKEVSKAVVARIKIPVPHLEKQRRIAAILDEADALRAKRREALALLDELQRGIFIEMFGNPATNPKGWKTLAVGQAISDRILLDIQDGNHGEKHPKVADFSGDGVPFIMANCIVDGELDIDKAYKLDAIWLKKLRVGFAKSGDLILSHKGTIGQVAIIGGDCSCAILSPQTTYYRPGECLDVQFLAGYFRTPWFQSLLEKEAKQSTRAYIGITRQQSLPLLIPPLDMQKEFAKRVELVSAIRAQNAQFLKGSDELAASLQHRAFRGEL